MSTELFLGGLASLILAAVIIVAMTTNREGSVPDTKKEHKDRK